MRRLPFLVLALGLPAASATAQVVTEMTQQRIAQAIALGVEQKPAPYALRTPSSWIEFDTPFLRVCERAATADSADASIATPGLLAPELRVTAGPEPFGDDVPAIKKLMIVQADGASIAPKSQESFVDYAQTARRRKIALRGVRAVFPLAALKPGARFRLVMSDGREQLMELEPGWFSTPR